MGFTPTLEICKDYADRGLLDAHVSQDGSMIGFKYSRETVYGKHWDSVTLACRGIVFDVATGKVLAHPFDKFFNFEELFDENGQLTEIGKAVQAANGNVKLGNHFRSMDKLDGSLGIMFYTGKKWMVKTGGSFDSDQAKWANCWAENHIDTLVLKKGTTYCFEIIEHNDPHVCKYDYEGLVLLGIFDDQHNEADMKWIKLLAELLNVRYSENVEFNSIQDAIQYARCLDDNHEGFVITFDNGFKMKIKGAKYLEQFHFLTGVTKKSIREHFDIELGHVNEEYSASIPEELADMKRYVKDLNEEFDLYKRRVLQISRNLTGLTGRERYEVAISYDKILAPFAIDVCNNKKVNERIFHKVVDKLKKRTYVEFGSLDI